jgi:hypothetical protein
VVIKSDQIRSDQIRSDQISLPAISPMVVAATAAQCGHPSSGDVKRWNRDWPDMCSRTGSSCRIACWQHCSLLLPVSCLLLPKSRVKDGEWVLSFCLLHLLIGFNQ